MKRKTLFICCLLTVIVGLMVPAYAVAKGGEVTTATSFYVTKTCVADGKEYASNTTTKVNPYDELDEGGAYVGSQVLVYCKDKNTQKVPAGYMGGEPRLYLDGYLLLAEGWSYNNGTGNAFFDYYETYFTTRRGIVYSKSKFGLYNGDGYDVYDTNKSPSIDVGTIDPQEFTSVENEKEIQPYLEVNESGQTYGTDYFDNFTPELIAAIGVDGVRGYVYDAELTSVGLKTSLDEVVTDIPTSIPLYDADGVTVIGEFPIGHR